MATKKKTTETRTKAAVGRERRLALALRGLLEATGDDDRTDAESVANTVLNEFGYKDLESIQVRVGRLNDALKQAVEAGDGKLIAQLGNELDRAQQGLPPSKAKVAGKSRRTPAPSTPAAPAASESSSSES